MNFNHTQISINDFRSLISKVFFSKYCVKSNNVLFYVFVLKNLVNMHKHIIYISNLIRGKKGMKFTSN